VITGPGRLNPSAVAAPAGVTIVVTVVSGDRRPHRFTLRTAPPRTLAIPARGRASAQVTALKDGSYALDVDGATAGSLTIGVHPGP
jgi:hypothetical protein